MFWRICVLYSLMLQIATFEIVSDTEAGHMRLLVEILDVVVPPIVGGTPCCNKTEAVNCSVCDLKFAFCLGRMNSANCSGVTLLSTGKQNKPRAQFPVLNLTSVHNSWFSLTIFHDVNGTRNLTDMTSDLADQIIDRLSGTMDVHIDTDFWSSTQHLITLTKCASVTLGIRLFCESNYYGPQCNTLAEPDDFHHVVFNGSVPDFELDCQQDETSVINILTTDPYRYTLPVLKRALTLFLFDRVCPLSARELNLTINNVRHSGKKLRVVLQAVCIQGFMKFKLSDLEIHHALNFLTDEDLLTYFGNMVERTDESEDISVGRFNIVYRLLDYSGPNITGQTLEIRYGNESRQEWVLSGNQGVNYCYRGMPNSNVTNTVHIISKYPASEDVPLQIFLFQDGQLTSSFQHSILNLSSLHVASASHAMGNSYRHFFQHDLLLENKTTGHGILLGMFFWCSNGIYGESCEKDCPENETDCNFDKCSSQGNSLSDFYQARCQHGTCTNTSCFCQAGYIGPYCAAQLNECSLEWTDNPCGSGVCKDEVEGYRCSCPTNFTGEHCENTFIHAEYTSRKTSLVDDEVLIEDKPIYSKTQTVQKQCVSNASHCGNGTLVQFRDNVSCFCDAGFRGSNCDQVDFCSSLPCPNSAKCINGWNNFSCQCENGYSGPFCENHECTENSCENGALCNNNTLTNALTCICPDFYVGERCEISNFCASAPCEHNATCQNTEHGFKCICAEDYFGRACHILRSPSQYIFETVLPARKPEMDNFNVTEGILVIIRNLTSNCTDIYVKHELKKQENRTVVLYVEVLCDRIPFSSRDIRQEFESHSIDELLKILHLVPITNKTSTNEVVRAEDSQMWVEKNWIILTGLSVGLAALCFGALVASCQVIRTKKKNAKHHFSAAPLKHTKQAQPYTKHGQVFSDKQSHERLEDKEHVLEPTVYLNPLFRDSEDINVANKSDPLQPQKELLNEIAETKGMNSDVLRGYNRQSSVRSEEFSSSYL